MVRLRALRTLVMVAELRSFSRAAAHLNTTQPAVSARIRGMEEGLGRKLVLREGREVRLSADGEAVLRYARQIVDMADRLDRLFAPEPVLTGTVRIGAIDTIVHSWLLMLFEHLQDLYPGISYEVKADISTTLIEDLTRGEIDVALVMGPVEHEGVESLPLGEFPMAWVYNPRSFELPETLDVQELLPYPIISYPRGSKPYRMIESYFADAAVAPRLNCSNSLPTLIRLVQDGFGIAAIPPVLIRREIAADQLRLAPVRQVFPPLACHAAYYAASEDKAAARVAQLSQEVATRFWSETTP